MIKIDFFSSCMNQIKLSVITDVKYRQTVTNNTLYYCYSITTASQIVYMKTLHQQQAEKIQNGQSYILRKFYQSSDGIQTTITLHTDTKIFQTSQFDYDIQVRCVSASVLRRRVLQVLSLLGNTWWVKQIHSVRPQICAVGAGCNSQPQVGQSLVVNRSSDQGGGTAAVMRRACRAMGRGRRCLRLVTHSALFMVLYVIPFINIGQFS